jgi:hypothetical protein
MQTNTPPAKVHPLTLFVITRPQPAHANIAILSMNEPIASKTVAQHQSRGISATMQTKLVTIEDVIALTAGIIVRGHLATVQIFDPALGQVLAIHHQDKQHPQHPRLEFRYDRKRRAFEIGTLLRSGCLLTTNIDQ